MWIRLDDCIDTFCAHLTSASVTTQMRRSMPRHAQACHCKSNGDLDGDKGKKNHWAGSSTVTVLCAPEQSVHSHIPRQHKRLPWYDGDMWWGHYLYPRLFTKFCCYSICKLELHFVGQSGWVTCISVIAWLHWIYVTTIDNPTPIIVILIIYIISSSISVNKPHSPLDSVYFEKWKEMKGWTGENSMGSWDKVRMGSIQECLCTTFTSHTYIHIPACGV